MSMDQAIRDFPRQFLFEPTIVGAEGGMFARSTIHNLMGMERRKPTKFVVAGMGGSALAADLLRARHPDLDLLVHRGYLLPDCKDLDDRLIIVSSYSGNTEEALDAYAMAIRDQMGCVVLTTGGELLQQARMNGTPFIALPNTGIQPRIAIGFATVALASVMGRDLAELRGLADALHPDALESAGKRLADILHDRIPIVYASAENAALAYTWKVTMNETGKIPAFMNVLPEANHNEMTGFDATAASEQLSSHFHCVFITDAKDHPSVQRRMKVTAALYAEHHITTTALEVNGASRWERLFSTVLMGNWAAYHLALRYGAEPDAVPMVEEFKKRLA